jgi:hypothetical protein
LSLTAKPTIPAATTGALSGYFRIPEFLNLGSGDRRLALREIKAFADGIGYPVAVKGGVQGAVVCHSWAAVRSLLGTQTWVQGGFVQRIVYGWERCLAFAAHDGRLLGKDCFISRS